MEEAQEIMINHTEIFQIVSRVRQSRKEVLRTELESYDTVIYYPNNYR
jgi:hypothetical protein